MVILLLLAIFRAAAIYTVRLYPYRYTANGQALFFSSLVECDKHLHEMIQRTKAKAEELCTKR